MKPKSANARRKHSFLSTRSANGVRMSEMLVFEAGIDSRRNPAPIMERIRARLEQRPVTFASRPLKPRQTGSGRS